MLGFLGFGILGKPLLRGAGKVCYEIQEEIEDTVCDALEKVDDIRTTIEDSKIETEYYMTQIKNDKEAIKVYKQCGEYGKEYIKDTLDYMNYYTEKYVNDMKTNKYKISTDLKEILQRFETTEERITVLISKLDMTRPDAMLLLLRNGLYN